MKFSYFNFHWRMCLMNSGLWRTTTLLIVHKKLLNFQLARDDFYFVSKGKLCGSPEWFNSVSFSTHWLDRKKQKTWKWYFVTHWTLPLQGRKIWWWNQCSQWMLTSWMLASYCFIWLQQCCDYQQDPYYFVLYFILCCRIRQSPIHTHPWSS